MLLVRVSLTLRSLEIYMVVNFKTRKNSRGAHKLTRAPILIKKKTIKIL
jgi:hypothetical protein